MKYICARLSLSLLVVAVVGAGCNQNSGAKLDAGMTIFEPATLSATWASAMRSLPGTLASTNDASRRGAGRAIEVISPRQHQRQSPAGGTSCLV